MEVSSNHDLLRSIKGFPNYSKTYLGEHEEAIPHLVPFIHDFSTLYRIYKCEPLIGETFVDSLIMVGESGGSLTFEGPEDEVKIHESPFIQMITRHFFRVCLMSEDFGYVCT